VTPCSVVECFHLQCGGVTTQKSVT